MAAEDPCPPPPLACSQEVDAAVRSPAKPKAVGAVPGALGPAWTRGELEVPAGEKDMGGSTAAVYTEEQQARLGVCEDGTPREGARAVDLQ